MGIWDVISDFPIPDNSAYYLAFFMPSSQHQHDKTVDFRRHHRCKLNCDYLRLLQTEILKLNTFRIVIPFSLPTQYDTTRPFVVSSRWFRLDLQRLKSAIGE